MPLKASINKSRQFRRPLKEVVRDWRRTTQTFWGHWLNTLSISTKPRCIHLDWFEVQAGYRRMGIGSCVMRKLCELADEQGVPIELRAGKRGDVQGTTSQARLFTFYRRFGFQRLDLDDATMRREPRLNRKRKAS